MERHSRRKEVRRLPSTYPSVMGGTRPPIDPRAHGFLAGWVSNAQLWSATTKRLLNTNEPGETALAMVALHLCLKYTCLLIEGRAGLPADVQARATCPIQPRRLRRWRDRLQGFRDEVLHISDESEEGRGLKWHWTASPPHFAFESSIGRRTFRHDKISRAEIEELLKLLDPWLRDHWERLVLEEDVDQAALGAKIDATMGALGGPQSQRRPSLEGREHGQATADPFGARIHRTND